MEERLTEEQMEVGWSGEPSHQAVHQAQPIKKNKNEHSIELVQQIISASRQGVPRNKKLH